VSRLRGGRHSWKPPAIDGPHLLFGYIMHEHPCCVVGEFISSVFHSFGRLWTGKYVRKRAHRLLRLLLHRPPAVWLTLMGRTTS
jgi:hypothetical protein